MNRDNVSSMAPGGAAAVIETHNLADQSVSKGVLIMVVVSIIAVFVGARQFGRAIA